MSFSRTKITWLLLFTGFYFHAKAQSEIAIAEQAFAQMAKDSGTKKAFIQFLDSSSLIFYKGQSHNALSFWKNLSDNGGLLLWKPVYTGMAASGEMGFSTGPFEQHDVPAGPVNQSGNYSSIWVKNKQGQWKVLIDLGMPYKPSLFQKNWEQTEQTGLLPATTATGWQQVEQELITHFQHNGRQAFLPYLTNGSWFNIQDQSPLHTAKDIKAGLQQIPADLQFQYMGGALSAAGDLFYAYGIVDRHGNKENYLRVWGHKKDGWKLLLQVLRWVR
ncbi:MULTISPECIES: hypothetical protein [Niastella]|uniref:DUF4440 domain-containing protein n=1 Tax=Niastella soli TaxID=2821487 RepID=A0ABS3YN84_9BACT|nr:hypothetical protein [Niastella soli]MBO9199357.1 hypothetical protein [Niastella soli]